VKLRLKLRGSTGRPVLVVNTGDTVITLEVQHGELVEGLTKQVASAGITNGAIVSLIGAVNSFTLSTMPADDATSDVITDYSQPAEMSGTGEIIDGVVHIHATMAVAGDKGLSGHLHRALVDTWFARAYVMPTTASGLTSRPS
jgi:predicted DNA-binding protein with PD1-like motif